MTLQYWASRKAKKLGPFDTREEAIEAGRALLPKQPLHKDTYCTGYGAFGAHFDIRFHSARQEN